MTTRRPDEKVFWTLLQKTVVWWDAGVAVVAGAVTLWVGLSDEAFDPAVGFFLAGVPASIALVAGVFTLQRHMDDRLHDQDYGEIVQAVDPELLAATLPYRVVAVACFVSAAVSAVGAFKIDDSSPGAAAVIAALAVATFTYALVGLAVLYVLTMRHRTLVARVESAKQRAARAQRAAQAHRQ